MKNFYCQKKCGDIEFSIKEWNKSYEEIQSMPICEYEKNILIDGCFCFEQCFDCMVVVGRRQLETKKMG
ncbi:MAG: hypothetical protein IH845_04790 [Nanoarchaeota archaeon]|nr:hypothetical protein [Nanoarchaeota archaeon]